MGWEEILKRRGMTPSDIRLVNYILRDGEFKTADAIMDEIYDLLVENKKLGYQKVSRMRGRPHARIFRASKSKVKEFMTSSPDHESRNSGNKNYRGEPIKEYRYIGE